MSQIKLLVNQSRVVNVDQSVQQLQQIPDWYETANQLLLRDGPEASFGQFCIDCRDYQTYFPEQSSFDIDMESTIKNKFYGIKLRGYYTVTSQQVFRSTAPSYLVTVADARYYLRHRQTNRTWNVGSETSRTWSDVLYDLQEDLGFEYTAGIWFINMPPGQPCNLKYEGWRTLDALQDIASRTGHMLLYDPFDATLRFAEMIGSQPEVEDLVQNGLYHRVYDPTDTDAADGFDSARVNYDFVNGKPSGSNDPTGEKSENAWATCLADCNGVGEALQNEIDLLTEVWQNYSYRLANRDAVEFIGPEEVKPGSEVAAVHWQIKDNEIFTVVDIDAPTRPDTKRQKTNDRLIKFKTLGELEGCSQIQGQLMECGCSPDETVVLNDKAGLAKLYKEVEAGWMGYCIQSPDNQTEYDIVSLGKGCCGGDEEEEPPCPPDTIVWYETDIRCVTTTGTTAPGELHQYKRQNEYYFDGWCPSVTQGAWFYDKRVACKIDCCDAEPPEPCEHCDCCVRFGFGYYEPQVWKRTTINQGGWTEYRNCDEPCHLYMTDAEFCDNINLNANEDFACPEGKIAYWHIELYCLEGSDDTTPDTWKVCASRYCSDSQPAMTEPPTGDLWDAETNPCCREIQMLCNESSVSAPWTCVQYNEENVQFECVNPITIEVVDCPETCGSGILPTECDVYDPECTYTPPDPDECVHCTCCLQVHIGNVTTHLVKTQTLNGSFVVYKKCTDPCFLYFDDAGILPPECTIPTEFLCEFEYAVWRVTFECDASTSASQPDLYRVTAERLCTITPGGEFPENDEVITGTILISGTATVEMLCDETEKVYGTVTTQPTSSTNPFSCNIPFWIRKAPDSSCDSCGTADCLDIDPTCGGDPPPDPGGGGGGGGGDPGGP